MALLVLDHPGEYASVASDDIVREWRASSERRSVREYLGRKGMPVGRYVELTEAIIAASELVVPTGEPPPCRDEKDRKYLHCAVAAEADYLVTTDLDMLVLETIGETRIIRPGALWQFLSAT